MRNCSHLNESPGEYYFSEELTQFWQSKLYFINFIFTCSLFSLTSKLREGAVHLITNWCHLSPVFYIERAHPTLWCFTAFSPLHWSSLLFRSCTPKTRLRRLVPVIKFTSRPLLRQHFEGVVLAMNNLLIILYVEKTNERFQRRKELQDQKIDFTKF